MSITHRYHDDMPVTGRPLPPSDDAGARSRAKAIATPLRMRILRLCLHEARTNKEMAEELGINPGTLLHHVRSLAKHGFLRAEEPRRGSRGAREVPYRATGLSWRHEVPAVGPLLIETFLAEIDGLHPDDIVAMRMGLKLNPEHREELLERVRALIDEYAQRDSDPDGEPISLFFAEHPDRAKPWPGGTNL